MGFVRVQCFTNFGPFQGPRNSWSSGSQEKTGLKHKSSDLDLVWGLEYRGPCCSFVPSTSSPQLPLYKLCHDLHQGKEVVVPATTHVWLQFPPE